MKQGGAGILCAAMTAAMGLSMMAGPGARIALADWETAPYASIGRTGQDHFKRYQGHRTDQLLDKIVWLDFSDQNAHIENVDIIRDENGAQRSALKVGSSYERQWGDYRMKATVTELKPFQATEIFRQRAQQAQAQTGFDYMQFYQPDAANDMRPYFRHLVSGRTHLEVSQGGPVASDPAKARLVFAEQDGYSAMRRLGLSVPGAPTIRSAWNGANVGFKLNVQTWYKGEEVKPNIVMADGEEAGSVERSIFTTDGKPWELMTELANAQTVASYRPLTHNWETLYDEWDYPSRLWNNVLPDANTPSEQRVQDGVPHKNTTRDEGLRDINAITGDGIGTQVFGPVSTHIASRYSVPIVMSRDASNVGLYINTPGRQSGMIGLLFFDQGDAPEPTYQQAQHLLRYDGDRSANPYLGDTPPDLDVRRAGGVEPAWTNDDISDQPDEGERQLTGGANNGRYAVHLSTDPGYRLEVRANAAPSRYDQASVKGWVDANNNGRFDDGEGSDMMQVTADRNGRSATITLPFSSLQPNIDPSVTRLGARVRIATNANDIRDPGGVAYSGEVEDFQIQQIHPPRGSYAETTGPQGQPQRSAVHFDAYGELQYTTTPNAMDDAKDAWIVGSDGGKAQLDNDGYYVVRGEGKYRVSGRGRDITVDFVPEPQFIGRARGIVVRALDRNGNDTGWKVPVGAVGAVTPITSIDTMDSEYVPTVTPITATLTLVQGVDNTYAGRYGADPEGWTLSAPRADGQAGGVDPKPADGAFAPDGAVVRKTSGTFTLDPGRYTLTQQPNADYRKDGAPYRYLHAYAPGDWSCTDEQGQRVAVGGDRSVELRGQAHVTCVVTDTARPGAIIWHKVDAADHGRRLAGSVWSLTSADVPGFADMTVSDNGAGDADRDGGSLKVASLTWGDYALRETQAPDGYELADTTWTVHVLPVDGQGSPASTDNDGFVVQGGDHGLVGNEKLPEKLFALPLTGGRTGREWLALGIGLLTMAAAAIAGYAVMRRRQQHDLGLAAGR